METSLTGAGITLGRSMTRESVTMVTMMIYVADHAINISFHIFQVRFEIICMSTRSAVLQNFYDLDQQKILVLQQSLNKSLSYSPTGGTSFVNIYQNVRLDP